jgi:2-phosphosulfolactate phosphatase
MNQSRTIEVCFSPVLFPYILNKDSFIVVIIDVLRASTSICTGLKNGVRSIIPVAGIEEAKKYKDEGYIVAAERNGIKLDFADIGNSPFNFTPGLVRDRDIVYSTTNGTQALKLVKDCPDVVVGCFNNLSVLTKWIVEKNKNVLLLCSGWKQKFSLEDAVCAGAFIEEFLKYPDYYIHCDSATASLDLWNIAKNDLLLYMEKALHRHRLRKHGLDDVLEYTFTLNSINVIPRLVDGAIINALKK